MKIIAKTSEGYNKSFLVQMTEDEIARLKGFYSANTSGATKIEIGTELDINKVYDSIRNISSETRPNYGLESKAKELRALADSLDNLKVDLSAIAEIAQKIN